MPSYIAKQVMVGSFGNDSMVVFLFSCRLYLITYMIIQSASTIIFVELTKILQRVCKTLSMLWYCFRQSLQCIKYLYCFNNTLYNICTVYVNTVKLLVKVE